VEIPLNIIIGGLLLGGIYALLAVGFNLQYGVSRVLNASHGEFIMIGAMSTYTLFTLGINPFISLAIIGPALFMVGYIIYRYFFERLRKTSESPEVFESRSLLFSFGLLFVMQNIALLIWGANYKTYQFIDTRFNLFGAMFETNRLIVLLVAAALALTLYLWLLKTRLGKAIRAATSAMTSAQLVGINTRWVHVLCFALGALLAGVTGVLISMLYTLSPFIGMQYTIISIIVIILGGLGNILGSLIGGLILGTIGSIVLYIEPALSMIVYYMLFMFIILLKPKGLFGK
jgi:branched-chain amino acid transport system permease protein